MKTKVAIASDDLGFDVKEQLKQYLIEEKNVEIVFDPIKVKKDGKNSYCNIANEMAKVIQTDQCRLGIYVCGTGIGFTCQINKHYGIRAVAVTNPYSAKRARLSNNAQVIGLGCRVNGFEYLKDIVNAWFDNPFDFDNARENSKLNLLAAKKNDEEIFGCPNYIKWNMGFTKS